MMKHGSKTLDACDGIRCHGDLTIQHDGHYPTCPLYRHMSSCLAHGRYPSDEACPTCTAYIAAGL